MKTNNNKRVFPDSIFVTVVFFAVLLPFFEPAYIEDCFPFLDTAVLLWKIVGICIISILVLRSYGFSLFVTSVAALHLLIVFVTILNSGNVLYAFKTFLYVVAICLAFDLCIKRDAVMFVSLIKWYFFIILIISISTSALHPEGLYYSTTGVYSQLSSNDNAVRYFLGHKNGIVTFLIPGILASVVSWLLSKQLKNMIFALVFIVLATINAFIVDSATSLIICIAIIMAMLLSKMRLIQNSSPLIWIAAALFLNLAIVFFHIQDFFIDLFGVMGRDATLSGRTIIWDWAIFWIEQNPIFGYGIENVIDSSSRFGFGVITSAHNILLTTLYHAGAIGLALLLVCIFLVCLKLKSSKSRIAAFLKIFISLLLIMGTVESLGIGLSVIIFPLLFAQSINYLAPSG